MTRALAILVAGLLACTALGAAPQEPAPVFRAGVERVTVAATVKTRRHKPVLNLTRDDFQLYDNGFLRPITEFRSEAGPVSLALLVDFSGSMGVAARRQATYDAAYHLVTNLTPGVDEAGLYVFDSRLRELQAVAPAPGNILAQLEGVSRPFGATSLFDAIAETGRTVAATGGARRAVVAITDGADNFSRLTPEQVSGIASAIDVPVYVMVVVSPFDRFGRSTVDDPRLVAAPAAGPLANLARWTGGEIHVGVGPLQTGQAARQIVTDLRQQYLIAFEPGHQTGWHPIELRIRDKPDLVVRARGGYVVEGPREGL